MSSGTSTESPALVTAAGPAGPDVRAGGPTGAPRRTSAPAGDGSLQPWQLFTLAGLVGATFVVFMSRGESPASVIALSFTIFAAAVVGVAALRAILPLTRAAKDDGPQVLGGRTRAALEREKALVLRSIKELEFDRAMGKISEKDFVEMDARLRVRAIGLLRQLDAGSGYRQDIEREVERRLREPAAALDGERAPEHVHTAADPEIEEGPSAERTADAPTLESRADRECAACQTHNDVDARFCKRCGGRLEAAP